ncbi:olfactory receptor 52N4-like [Trichomycterus rosablanca]|uniref:olfactory receptor 52N4-like n=1 Tax=Trichomycterus rosablanca TaxID=2290929 RepID=UPI002F35CA19
MAAQVSNSTFSFNLQIARFDLPPQAVYPVVITGTLIYLFSVLGNVTILALIVTQPKLHKPMFYIMFSLPLADLVGITVCLPRILVDIVTQENTVFYPTCVLQAFLIHFYGGGVVFVLAAMSIDRYVAICHPLRYHSIMNSWTVCGIIAVAWGVDFILIGVLFILQSLFPKCKTFIATVYCNNTSLLKLACGGDFTVNNVYGLAITAFFHGVSLAIQLLCYTLILKACFSHTTADARSKALNTCLAQLITFVLYEFISLFTIVSYRFDSIPPTVQKVIGLLIFTVLPVINPIIFGMKTKDIRNTFLMVLKKTKGNLVSVA